MAIENSGAEYVMVYSKTVEGRPVKVIGNSFVNLQDFVPFDPAELKLSNKVYFPVLKWILENYEVRRTSRKQYYL